MKARLSAALLLARPLTRPRQCRLQSLFVSTDASTAASSSSSSRIITYLTDIEGDAAYLDRFVSQSQVLEWRECSTKPEFPYNSCIDFISDHSMLVFGGDVWDRGGSDLYVIRQLLDLQKRHYGRVHFVMGNRDINKMRVVSELGLDKMPYHGGVYWLRGTGRVGDPLQNSNVHSSSPAKRLQWMLSQTMGSPHAFELRKKELQRDTSRRVSDDDVVASYRHSCHPQGEMGQYLSNSHLVLQLGSILFVHGALPLTQTILEQACEQHLDARQFWNDLGFAVPWSSSDESKPQSIQEWLELLEKFRRSRVSAWRDYVSGLEDDPDRAQHGVWSTKGGYHHHMSGINHHFESLMQYGMGWTCDGNRNPTVVYSSWLSNGLPRRFYEESLEHTMFTLLLKEFFHQANLQLIVSGHQPHGDMPTPIRIDDSKCILCCDTSYSGDTLWYNHDGSEENRTNFGRGSGSSGRGNVAVSEVLIEQDVVTGDVLNVQCHGTLSDGSRYKSRPFRDASNVVGRVAGERQCPTGGDQKKTWWVKAKLEDGSYLVSSGEGFNVWNCIVPSVLNHPT